MRRFFRATEYADGKGVAGGGSSAVPGFMSEMRTGFALGMARDRGGAYGRGVREKGGQYGPAGSSGLGCFAERE